MNYINLFKKGINYDNKIEKYFMLDWNKEIMTKREKYSRIRGEPKENF